MTELTLNDVLVAINHLDMKFEAKFDRLETKVDRLETKVDTGFDRLDRKYDRLEAKVDIGFAQMRADINQLQTSVVHLREDIAGVKADTAYCERGATDLQEALRRHIEDTNLHGGGREAA